MFTIVCYLLYACTAGSNASMKPTLTLASSTPSKEIKATETLVRTISIPTPFTTTPTATATSTLFPSPTQTNTNTPIPILPVVTEWLTYTYPITTAVLTIQYPSNWQVHPNYESDIVSFTLDNAIDNSNKHYLLPYYVVALEVYQRPSKYISVTNPHTWEPNEGGYTVIWERPIQIQKGKLSGIEFMWGTGSPESLNAIIYDPQAELDIRLRTFFNSEGIEYINAEGYEAVLDRYWVFEYMLHSIQSQVWIKK